MKILDTVALVTGANRGIGHALVKALLKAGAKKVYAAARDTSQLTDTVALDSKRVVAIQLDVTNEADLAALPGRTKDVRLLINNAGALDFGTALDVNQEAVRRNLEVNFFGPLETVRQLAPVMEANGGGAIVNIASIVAFASMPGLAGYNASKAALWSLTQSQRGTLAAHKISVHGVFPGPVDTDMAAALDIAKTSPEDVAEAIVNGVNNGEEDIYPDPMAKQVYAAWSKDHKSVEHQFGAM